MQLFFIFIMLNNYIKRITDFARSDIYLSKESWKKSRRIIYLRSWRNCILYCRGFAPRQFGLEYLEFAFVQNTTRVRIQNIFIKNVGRWEITEKIMFWSNTRRFKNNSQISYKGWSISMVKWDYLQGVPERCTKLNHSKSIVFQKKLYRTNVS